MDAKEEHRRVLPVRRSRVRRVLKWVGTVACAVIVLMAITCLFWTYVAFGFESGTIFAVECGGVGFFWGRNEGIEDKLGLMIGPIYPSLRDAVNDWSVLGIWPVWDAPEDMSSTFFVPLWIPIVAIGLPTAFLWRLDRRRPVRGACRNCNYDLTGNTSGRCPECGAALKGAA